ncbi:MAG: hypothetical protein FWH42_05980 [Dehalococcoidia bacterium]|nr:hypothetical protein [Dehalococcoidia bacterium]
MKRMLCLLCTLMLTAGLLVACGKSGGPTPPPSDSNTPTSRPAEEQSSRAEGFALPGALFNANWPENEFTEQVPKPAFETTLGVPGKTGFSVICVATVDQLKNYVKDLKRAGFKKNASTTDKNTFGMAVYNYTASNRKGYTVEVN